MRVRRHIGLISLVLGAVAVPLACFAAYFRSLLGGKGTSIVVDWLMSRGITFRNPDAVQTLSAPSLLLVTDTRAVAFLIAVSVVLASAAMLLALVAEHRRQHTLYLSAGYMCGALAIFVLQPLFGLIAMIAGIAAAMVMRHGRGARDT